MRVEVSGLFQQAPSSRLLPLLARQRDIAAAVIGVAIRRGNQVGQRQHEGRIAEGGDAGFVVVETHEVAGVVAVVGGEAARPPSKRLSYAA